VGNAHHLLIEKLQDVSLTLVQTLDFSFSSVSPNKFTLRGTKQCCVLIFLRIPTEQSLPEFYKKAVFSVLLKSFYQNICDHLRNITNIV